MEGVAKPPPLWYNWIMKKCTKCKKLLREESFKKNKRKKDGLSTECRECSAEQDRLYRQKVKERNKDNNLASIELLRCSRCNEMKPSSLFNRDNSRPSGYGNKCKPCQKEYHSEWRKDNAKYEEYQSLYYEQNKERINERNTNYYYANKDWLLPKMNANRFFKKFGITQEDAKTLLDSQGGVCAICHTDTPTEKGWCVDHCHTTGKIRGILCSKCNSGIGFLNDDPELCKRAIAYLS